ncbi:hypothetical protein B7463_g347, partial [Scytalidium lignicola]
MGRPRKRKLTETAKDNNSIINQPQEPSQVLLPAATNDYDSYNDTTIAGPYVTDLEINSNEIVPDHDIYEELPSVFEYRVRGEMRGPDNFGDLDFLLGQSNNLSANQNAQLLNTSVPSTTGFDLALQKTSMPGTCGCLASMYLSLASLQEFPSDIKSALFTVRRAVITAEQVLYCPRCGTILMIEPNPSIESFQNTMLLGTILPIIANGYTRLLKMIDEETDAAITSGQMKTFHLQEYGGLCGKQNAVEIPLTCTEAAIFFNQIDLQPSEWRSAVRALLRIDIYGYEQSGCKHKGLRDLVSELELRQRTRHDLIDATIGSGNNITPICGNPPPHTRTCLQVLQIAKRAIDSLVIP